MFLIPKNDWNFINKERLAELEKIYNSIGSFYPKEENVLRFLQMPFNNLKCIIVGMEPYPTAFEKDGILIPEATGRSFEVSSLLGKSWDAKFKQSSLRNILKAIYYAETGKEENLATIRKEIQDKSFDIKAPGEWFSCMQEQGVLFLNASLTVEPNNVGSHKALWENFMTDLIKYIDENQNVVWMLWGKDAQERVLPYVKNSICTCHPRLTEFVKENCFADEKVQDINWKG